MFKMLSELVKVSKKMILVLKIIKHHASDACTEIFFYNRYNLKNS